MGNGIFVTFIASGHESTDLYSLCVYVCVCNGMRQQRRTPGRYARDVIAGRCMSGQMARSSAGDAGTMRQKTLPPMMHDAEETK